MFDNFGSLEASIQERLDSDTDFQDSLADLSEEDKENAIKTKKSELLDTEIKSLAEKATKGSKAEELANNYKKRAEKAEQDLKKSGKSGDEGKNDGDLSSKDTIALITAKVTHEEDIEEVVNYAKFRGISISEALKSPVVITLLSDKVEKRQSADATNTRGGRPGSQKVSDEQITKDLSEGKVPEPGSKEAEQLYFARRKKK